MQCSRQPTSANERPTWKQNASWVGLICLEDVNKQAAMAKLFLAESLKQVADMAIQCHGGYGYMEEYEVERVHRDAKLFEIGAGTSEIQKLIVAKQILAEAMD